MKSKRGVFVAGGTAGHINAALALGAFFRSQGDCISFISGQRPLDLRLFPAESCLHLPSEGLVGRGLRQKVAALLKNALAFFQALLFFLRRRPDFAMGAGGYVCGTVLLAAFCLRIPVFILEQNSVVGVTNKLLSYLSRKVFVHFPQVAQSFPNSKKTLVTGNPLPRSYHQRSFAPPSPAAGIHLLIFGGSLGALEINQLVQQMVTEDFGHPLCILHQTGLGKETKIKSVHPSIEYRQVNYIDDMAGAYQWAHLVICRGGATTVAELRRVAKPALILPLMIHRDKHQLTNAVFLQEEGVAPVAVEDPESLKRNHFAILRQFLERIRLGELLSGGKCHNPMPAEQLIFREIHRLVSPQD